MSRARNHDASAVDAAEAWLIGHLGKTYRDAADRFSVPVDALRARINNRYGSLAGARTGSSPKRVLRAVRRCICCGQSFASNAKRVCPGCTRRNEAIHDGGV